MGLKGIPSIISPELLKLLAEMGHGDTIVLADAHFPAHSIGKRNNIPVVRLDATADIGSLLTAILQLIDLDAYVDAPAGIMDVTDEDKARGMKTPLPSWINYQTILRKKSQVASDLYKFERFQFYKKAAEAFVIVITGDTSLYANIILTKGVTQDNDK